MKFKLLTVSAVIGLTCQLAYADKDTEYDLKSLADAPINLVNKTNIQSGASEGVKPNVMLFIDDSGSMRQGTKKGPEQMWGYHTDFAKGGCRYGKIQGTSPSAKNIKDPSELCFFGNFIVSAPIKGGVKIDTYFNSNPQQWILDSCRLGSITGQRVRQFYTSEELSINPDGLSSEDTEERYFWEYVKTSSVMKKYSVMLTFCNQPARYTYTLPGSNPPVTYVTNRYIGVQKQFNDYYRYDVNLKPSYNAPPTYIHFDKNDVDNVRILVVIKALHQILDEYQDKINWNISSLHGSETRISYDYPNGAGNNYILQPKEFMNEQSMRAYVNRLNPLGATPTTERYMRIGKIMADNIQYRCQKSYIVLLSDGDANGQGDILKNTYNGTLAKNKTDFGALYSPNGEFLADSNGVTYNGLSYLDNGYQEHQGISPLAKALFNQDLKTTTSANAKKARGCASNVGLDAECQSWDDEKHKVQKVETFTIGFGESLSVPGKAYLTHGGRCSLTEQQIYDKEIEDGKTLTEAMQIADTNKDGNISGSACFFNAAEASQLTSAFKHIFSAIDAANTVSNNGQKSLSISSSTTAGATTAESAVVFSLDTRDWASELKLAKLKADGITLERDKDGKPIYLSASYDDRQVVANFNGRNRELSANDYAQFGFTNKSEFEKGLFPWLIRSPNRTDAQIESDVAGLGLANRVVKTYRNRELNTPNNRNMGDVVGASNIAVGRDKNNRQKYIMSAANDGMVYIFKSNEDNATFNTKPYSLAMNYLPASMQREKNLTVATSVKRVAESDYGTLDNPHIYLNNGGITWILTSKTGNKKQQYVAFGNMGQGGRGAYVLNIGGEDRREASSVPVGLDAGSDIVTNVPFWETEKGANNKLGYTISAPIVGQISIDPSGSATGDLTDIRAQNVILGMFLANGYSTEDDSVPYDTSPTLYVYNAMGQEFGTSIKDSADINNGTAGQLIRAIPTEFNKPGALSTPILLDADLNGIYDYAFAGDEFGNLWQFNIYGAPSSWRAYQIYRGTLNNEGKATMPITASPEIYRVHGRERNHANFNKEFVVVFGTGSDVYDADLKDENRQALMGIYVDVTAPVSAPLQQNSNFLDQTMTNDDGSDVNKKENDGKLKIISPELAYTNGHVGWRIWLRTASTYEEVRKDTPLYKETHTIVRAAEKITTNPQILLGTVIVTTRMYEHTADIKIERKNQNATETCGIDVTTEKTKSGGDSLLMAVNATNGGNPDLTEGAYIKDRKNEKGEAEGFKAKVSVQKADPQTGQITSEQKDVGVIGKSLGGLASGAGVTNINAMNADSFQGTNYGSSGSGLGIVRTLEEGTPAGQTAGYTDERVACLDNSGKYVVGATVANEDDPYSAFEFDGKRCQTNNSFIRVNWREVSF